jgi:hypothetical protein
VVDNLNTLLEQNSCKMLHLLAANEEYDGTSWTEKNDLNTARMFLGGRSYHCNSLWQHILAIQVKKVTILKLGMDYLDRS